MTMSLSADSAPCRPSLRLAGVLILLLLIAAPLFVARSLLLVLLGLLLADLLARVLAWVRCQTGLSRLASAVSLSSGVPDLAGAPTAKAPCSPRREWAI